MTSVSAVRLRGDVLGGAVHPAEVRLAVVVHEERHDDDDGVGAGDGLGVVRGGAQVAGGHQPSEVLGEVCLAGEGLRARR